MKTYDFVAIPEEKIRCINYMITKEGLIKSVIRLFIPLRDVTLYYNEKSQHDNFNRKEPYDLYNHTYYFSSDELQENTRITCIGKDTGGGFCGFEFTYGRPNFFNEAELVKKYDHGIEIVNTDGYSLTDGVSYRHFSCLDRDNAPVEAFLLEIDTKKNTFYVGTPNDCYEERDVFATIPEMMRSAENSGKKVIAAINGDFFDICGDFSPSGLCIKNGKAIANSDSDRNFLGVKNNGKPIITNIEESPKIIGDLRAAVAGYQMVLRDGKLFDYAPLEPFSYLRHPRSCVGVRADGTLLLLIIDGRLPEYSNGATLVDLACFMERLGAERALNIDGGGSSMMYISEMGEYILKNRPADLHDPGGMLIRKMFNCIIVTG